MNHRAYTGETVPFQIMLVDKDQAGLTGQTVTLNILRLSDNYSWNGSAFQSGYTTVTMTEPFAASRPGYYTYNWTAVSGNYAAIALCTATTATFKRFSMGLVVTDPPATPPLGANTVTLTIQAGAGTPQSGAIVTIKNSAETTTFDVGITNASGVFTTHLNDGSYKVIVTKASYATWSTTSLTVSGTTAQTIVGTLISVLAPASPGLCGIFIFPTIDAVTHAVWYTALPNQVINGVMLDTTPIYATVVNDTIDYYRADLVQGGLYRVGSTHFAFVDCDFRVSLTDTTANLKDLVTQMREL